MSLTYGFYNSINSDRKYNAQQLSSIFDGVINDGVFMSIGTSLIVTQGSGMNVNVGIGRAWFNKTWTDNDSILPLPIDQAEVILYRIDTVVIETNATDDVRANSIKIIKGIPSSFVDLKPPVLIHSELVNQYPLAHICIAPGVTEITQDVILNTVGTSECPFITGILETINTDELIQQWESQFNAWFNGLKDVLTQNAETNIVNMINTHSENHLKHVDYVVATGTANTYAVSLTPAVTSYVDGMAICVKININSTGASTISVNGMGAKAILDSLGNQISGGGLKAGIPYTMRYNGTSFIVQGKGGGGTATADKILAPYTATNDTDFITGTIPTFNGVTMSSADIPVDTIAILKPQVGYYSPTAVVYVYDADYTPSNIVSTANVFGLQGSATINSLGGKRYATGTIPVDSNGFFTIDLGWKPSRFIISTETITPLLIEAPDYTGEASIYPQRQFMTLEETISELTRFNKYGYLYLSSDNETRISDGYTNGGITYYVTLGNSQVLGHIPIMGWYFVYGVDEPKPWPVFNQAVYYAWE